ncbi:MAG: multidrug efflux RND transporter permease subunit [Selenomonadaceae bacterium]|nr:multidrug efflux RND transporter permease subunit [Selenomonadaceae bacterium]
MARFFIHRPVFAIVISLMIVIIGTIAALQLPIDQYPQISPPTVNVSTTYTGANANVVNDTVAQVIEQQVNGTEGMTYMSSSSDSTGTYSLTVRFGLDTNADMDAVNVQNKVALANSTLPSDVLTAGVTTEKSSPSMALVVSIVSPNGTYEPEFLKNYSDIYLIDAIKRVPGVGKVQVFGSDYSMRVWVNPDKLAQRGLTMADVTQAIQKQNIQAPAGVIGQMPAPDTQEKQYTGTVQGRLVTPEEFGEIVLKTAGNGAYTRLKDVARIETGEKSSSVISKYNNQQAIGFAVQLTSDANAMDSVSQVQELLKDASKSFPSDMEYHEVVNNTNFIRASLNEVVHTFFEALALVVIIVFLFLQTWRATLIPLLAVPVSLVGTFGAFIVLGFSINTLTLFAMVLAIGLVVDDAIVVIENVEEHMESEGLGPIEATEVAMDEVQGPVVAIAFVLAAVFVPVAFLGGTTGVLYRQFALTIAISMALSAFIALTLTPALCGMLLKKKDKNEAKGPLGRFFDAFNAWFDRIRERYTGKVGWCISHMKLAIVFLLIVCGLTGLLFKILPSTFVPDEDQGYFVAAVMLPEGTSLNHTRDTVDAFATDLQKIPGVKGVMHMSGYDVLSSSNKSNMGTLFISLDDWAERKEFDKQIAQIVNQANVLGYMNHPEATIFGFLPPSLPGLGMVGGWTMELQDMGGHSDEELNEVTEKIIAAANQRPELAAVRTTYAINSPTYQFELDRNQVTNLGVNLSDVFTALQVNFGGYQVNDFNRFGRSYKVMLQSDAQYRNEAETLNFVFVRSDLGTMVPLSALVTPKLGTAPSVITRFNGTRSVSIQGEAGEGYSSGQAMAAIEEVVQQVAPNGYHVEWSGMSREEKQASGSTGQVMLLSLVFVFLSLAALYESWSVPYSVLMTIPIGVFGALFSEFAMSIVEASAGHPNAGLQNSVYMQIGIIMLMGLAAKNAILIVEFAKMRRDKGMDAVKAALESANLRLRPIIMTSLAFIIGCNPLAIATGAGAASRNGMGVAVVGGMLFATSLGIFLIPVFYVVVEKIAEKLKPSKKSE